MSKKFGFTLAEVAIVLVVVGIAAAMTIPMLVNNFTKDAQVSELRKVAQDFETAVYTETTNDGKNSFRLTRIFSTGNVADFLDRNFGTDSSSCENSGCFASSYKSITGNMESFSCSGVSRKLPGGAAVCVEYVSRNRVANRSSLNGFALLKLALHIVPGGPGGHASFDGRVIDDLGPTVKPVLKGEAPPYIQVQIDTNNTAGPNTGGRDMFRFYISEYGDVLGRLPYENTDDCLSWSIVHNTSTGEDEQKCAMYRKETITDEGEASVNDCKGSPVGAGCYTYLYQNDWVMDY